ncbi:MAG: ABC transporter permease [Candidatus Gracilibacteria bacterium]
MYTQYIIFQTIARRELTRIFRIWTQTIIPPILNQSLYFVIFGGVVGSNISFSGGVSYATFLMPGLVAMGVITNTYSNVVSSLFGSKFSRSMEEFLISPTHPATLFLGHVVGGMVRGFIIAFITWVVSLFFGGYFVVHPFMVFITISLLAYFFSALGFINALFAKTFDQVSIIPTFFLTPLSYLGGIFYPIAMLPHWAQIISYFNPIAWVITLLRYGFLGETHTSMVSIWSSLAGLIIVSAVTTVITLRLLSRGYGIRS